jgi:hypothetical protein
VVWEKNSAMSVTVISHSMCNIFVQGIRGVLAEIGTDPYMSFPLFPWAIRAIVLTPDGQEGRRPEGSTYRQVGSWSLIDGQAVP